MSFSRYSNYKDSGVEWLGDVPGHWEVAPLKRGFEVVLGKMLQNDASSPDDELVPYLRAANIKWDGVDISDIKQMWVSPRDIRQLALAAGDLLISEGGDVGRSSIWRDELKACYFQNSVNRVRSQNGNSTRFLYYWISAIKDIGFIDIICNKSTIAHFTAEKVAAVSVPFPTKEEQQTIAAFLDRETRKIDALIAEQRRLVELLAEKRQAVISHAVTKGLNPNVPTCAAEQRVAAGRPMKESGIEWLGEVPAHWTMVKIKHLVEKFEQGWSPQCEGFPVESEQEWGVLKVGCVNGGTFKPEENKTLPSNLEPIPALGILTNDLLISRANTRELVGSAAIARRDYTNLLLCDKLYRLRFLNDVCSPMFIALYLGTNGARGQIELAATGASSSMVNISQSTILELELALPEFQEQQAIAAFLEGEIERFNTLTLEAQRAIELLQERRSALISAAVTGKIDVRKTT